MLFYKPDLMRYLCYITAILIVVCYFLGTLLVQLKSWENAQQPATSFVTALSYLNKGEREETLLLDELKNKSTSQLAEIVLRNCRLTNFEGGRQGDKNLTLQVAREAARHTSEKEIQSLFCVNAKSGSTFLMAHVLQSPSNIEKRNYFIIIREPLHRLLSAFLNKIEDCDDLTMPRCQIWRPFAENVAMFVKRVNKVESNLYNLDRKSVYTRNVTFPDFVDYIIHMFYQNNGRVTNVKPEVPVWHLTWVHWMSVVENCDVCHAAWKDVVLFENLDVHLDQVKSKYPKLFKNDTPVIKPSSTGNKLKFYFDKLDNEQLWILGNVMYSVDYAILPYKFQDFLKSINREL